MNHQTKLKPTITIRIITALGILSAVIAVVMGSSTPFIAHAQVTDDWTRVRDAGRLLIGTSADYAPFESYNSNFQVDGFDIALAQELGKRLGVEVQFTDIAFSGLLDALQLGQVDVAIAAISVTPERQQVFDFSNLYYLSEDAVLTLLSKPLSIQGADDFANLRVGAELGTTYAYWAQQSLVNAGIIPQSALVTYTDTFSLLRGLRTGEIDAMMIGRLPAFMMMLTNNDLYPAGTGLNPQRFAIAARKGSTLIYPLNEALLELQADGTYSRLVSQYLDVEGHGGNDAPAAPVSIPVQAVAPVPTQAPPQAVQLPATPVPCINGMAYVADLNLDDQNMANPPVMLPGQGFTKSWRIRNSGNCEWSSDFALVFVRGNRPEASMAAQPLAIGRNVAPGETIDLSMNLQAPTVYGPFQAFFQMRDYAGNYFGEVIWAGIQVPDPNPPVQPTPTPAPAAQPGQANPNFRADNVWLNAGQCTSLRWDIDNISSIFLVDGNNVQGVGGHDSRSVCPGQTWTYVLRVVFTNGVTQEFPLTLNVTGHAPQPERPRPHIDNFSVSDREVYLGVCVQFSWNVRDADGVNLYRNGERLMQGGASNGSISDCPLEGDNAYRLEAYGNGRDEETINLYVGGGEFMDEGGGDDGEGAMSGSGRDE